MNASPAHNHVNHNRSVGALGESLATAHLVALGMRVIEQNWRCRYGELDLIMREGDTVVAVEVKTRTGYGMGSPLNAITSLKAARLRRLLYEWARGTPCDFSELRVDAIAVMLRPPSGSAVFDHLRGIS